MVLISKLGIAGALALSMVFALAQETPDLEQAPSPNTHAASAARMPGTVTFTPVTVKGFGDPATASYANLLRGVAAFETNRALAPLAPLKFHVTDLSKSSEPQRIRLETEDKVVDIDVDVDVDVDGDFVLPGTEVVGSREGILVSNRRSGELFIDPRVVSAGFTPLTPRMGDRRLQCEVTWAVFKDDANLMIKAMAAISGSPCKSPRIKVYSKPYNHNWQSVTVVEGERRLELKPHWLREYFVLPLQDTSWSHDAVIQFTKAEKAPSSP